MSHKGSYKWFRRTQVILKFGRFYKEVGILLGSMMWRGNSQGRKRKVVNKLPCKSYIN